MPSITRAPSGIAPCPLPLGERVRRGYALEGLSYIGLDERTGNLVFECMANNARFREDDDLFLHQNHLLLVPTLEVVDEKRLEVNLVRI